MAIEDILRALDEQADADCRALVDNAKVQAKSILGEAKAEADRVRDAKVAATEVQAHARATQIVNAAKLERRRQIAVAQDAGIDEVYAAAGKTLGDTRGTGLYETLFRALAKEATAAGAGDVVVEVAPGDAELASKVMSELGISAEVETEPRILGGLTVISGGGRVYRRNTFDARLTKVRKVVRSEVAEILFA
jgi:V/A-type H+-transporting ATPase subunit E